MKKLYLILFFLISINMFSQVENYGISGGLSFSFGNKINRIGLSVSAFYAYNYTQVNASVNAYYNFKTLAINKKTPELQLGFGVQMAWNKDDTITNKFVGLTENNTIYRNSLGYSFLYYFDGQTTSQAGGIININIDKFTFATQNDLFSFLKQGALDRYRTGSFLVEYRYNDTQIGLNSTFWTGNYYNSTKVTDSDYPARFGYRSSDKSILGNFSAALTSVQIKQILPYNQIAKVNIGVDSERIRHLIQNKIMHDQYFFPENWIKEKQMHIPMLQKNGEQYLFREGQEIKTTTIYFNLGLNEPIFY